MKHGHIQVPGIVRIILERLGAAGFETYVVGGAVRDMVMGRTPSDWDLATLAPAEEVEALFPHLTRFSLQHGTITLVSEGKHYEVSTFRGPSPTIEDDLAHRDFTVNAMAWEPDERKWIDPWGGSRDVERRLVRAVGAPEERFHEDPLRILRAARIACELDFRIHPETRRAMSELAPMLSTVARERIRDELMKILLGRKPSLGFQEMVRTGIFEEVLPELVRGKGKRSAAQAFFRHILEAVDWVPATPTLRLAALFHDIAGPGTTEAHAMEGARIAEAAMRSLRFSERTVLDVTHLVRHHRDERGYASSWGESAVRKFVIRLGTEHADSFFCLRRADLKSHGEDTRLLAELEERARAQISEGFPQRVRDLALDGRRVMEVCGIHGGPQVGRILEALLQEVLDHPEWNTEEKLLERLKEINREP